MKTAPFFGKMIFVIAFAVLTASTPSELIAQDDVGYLRTRISPHVAGVFVDGKYQGTAAMFGHRQRMISLKPGTYKVEIVDPRFKTLTAKVTIEAGKTSTIRRRLEPAPVDTKGPFGELKMEGFSNAAIYLDGQYYANARELQVPGYSLLLRPGEYQMKIEPVSQEPVREEKIKINADETLIISKSGAPVRRK